MSSVQRQLSEVELKEFKEIFDLVDTDGSGEITIVELAKLMETLGMKPTEEQLEQMMKEVDSDGSGDIDFSEFVTVMSRKVQAEYTPEQLKAAFKVFESDELGPGWVKTETLEHALITYGEDRMTPEEAAELLSAVCKISKLQY